MNTILYFSASGAVYETRAYTAADITDLIQGQRLQCLTSADRQFDFWFSPTARRCQRHINRKATELLLATTTFTAKSVPLLRGSIVLASHDADGDLDGLSWLGLNWDGDTIYQFARAERHRQIAGKRHAAVSPKNFYRTAIAALEPLSALTLDSTVSTGNDDQKKDAVCDFFTSFSLKGNALAII